MNDTRTTLYRAVQKRHVGANLFAYDDSFINVNSFSLPPREISCFIVERSCKFTKSYLTAHSGECSLPYCSVNSTRYVTTATPSPSRYERNRGMY